MVIVLPPPEQVEQKVILHGVSWETYERLLADFENSHAAHFAYDQGVLEIMVLSFRHETFNRTLAMLVETLAEELEIDLINAGSTTFKRVDLARGFEPDTSFYIQQADRIRGKEEIDLAVDPPPDLVVEIDITSPSLDKLPIYAAVGVSEVWHYDGRTLTIFILEGGTYVAHEESLALPEVPRAVVSHFIDEGKQQKRTVWLRNIRDWVRRHGKGKAGDDPA
jgi:Uma2 family endonuclease